MTRPHARPWRLGVLLHGSGLGWRGSADHGRPACGFAGAGCAIGHEWLKLARQFSWLTMEKPAGVVAPIAGFYCPMALGPDFVISLAASTAFHAQLGGPFSSLSISPIGLVTGAGCTPGVTAAAKLPGTPVRSPPAGPPRAVHGAGRTRWRSSARPVAGGRWHRWPPLWPDSGPASRCPDWTGLPNNSRRIWQPAVFMATCSSGSAPPGCVVHGRCVAFAWGSPCGMGPSPFLFCGGFCDPGLLERLNGGERARVGGGWAGRYARPAVPPQGFSVLPVSALPQFRPTPCSGNCTQHWSIADMTRKTAGSLGESCGWSYGSFAVGQRNLMVWSPRRRGGGAAISAAHAKLGMA